jgi:hypothetical protein
MVLFARAPQDYGYAEYYVENLFFIPPELGGGLMIADWQMFMFGLEVFDNAYLLGGNLEPVDRSKHEMVKNLS